MEVPEQFKKSIIFPVGERFENESFTGAAWLQALVPPESTFNCPIFNVTFEPGTRNNWHKHPGGQILLVTGGRGYYQEEGKTAQVLIEGDVVKIPPDVKHWHGAAPDSWFSHIAINTNVHLGMVEWMEPVTDEEYSRLS
jgi:quercetin dioxygenase-like cupin family protein